MSPNSSSTQGRLDLAEHAFHPVPVRVPRRRFGPARGGDSLANCFLFQVVRRLVEQLIVIAVGRQVHAVAEQLRLAIVVQVVGQQQRPARDGLEDPHVHVIPQATIERQSRRGVDLRHLLEVGLADERPRVPPPEQFEQLGPRAREHVAHVREIILLGHVVLAVELGIAGQGQPRGGCDSLPPQPIRPVALGGEDEVESLGLDPAPIKVEVGIDRPPGRGMKFVRQVVLEPVIDVQEEVEAIAQDRASWSGRKWVTSTSPSRARRQ